MVRVTTTGPGTEPIIIPIIQAMGMGYITIHTQAGGSRQASVTAGLDTVTTVHITTHHGGDPADTVTATGMVITADLTGDITAGTTMDITMECILAAGQDILQDTGTGIIIPPVITSIKVHSQRTL